MTEEEDKGEKNMRESVGGCEILSLKALKQSFGSGYQELITTDWKYNPEVTVPISQVILPTGNDCNYHRRLVLKPNSDRLFCL